MQTSNMNKTKVNIYAISLFISLLYIQGPNNPRYKTILCKKYSTDQGCPYGDKCQFAHGAQELRLNNGQGVPQNTNNLNKSQNSLLNYKIVKCKNWEKDKTCKYGIHCTFAHGDEEIRHKTDNLYQFNLSMPSMPFMMPMVVPPNGMDFNQMQPFMVNGQMMMGMNMNQNIGQEQNNTAENNVNE